MNGGDMNGDLSLGDMNGDIIYNILSGYLTQLWKMTHLQIMYLLKVMIFHGKLVNNQRVMGNEWSVIVNGAIKIITLVQKSDLTNKTGQIWDETEIGIDDKIGYYMIL